MVHRSEYQQYGQVDDSHPEDVSPGDAQDIAEKETHQVRGIARRQVDEDNADGHTQRPEQPDSRIFTDLFPGGERFDAQCGQNGEQQRPQ